MSVSSKSNGGTVGIVGGGVTGLVAGFRLKQRGIDVTVYEASRRVGGVIQSTREDGFLAEHGPNSILETSPRIGALVTDLGLESRRIYSRPEAENRYIVRGARPVAMPSSPLGFFSCDLFTWRAKLALLREPFVRRSAPDVEENLAAFVLRRLGREFLDYAINPFVAGVYAGDPARLSVLHGFPKLRAIEQQYGSLILGQILGARQRKRRGEVSKQNAKKLSFDDGLQVLTDALGARLGASLELGADVTGLERFANDASGGWEVTVRDAEGRETRRKHAAVLLVSPAHRLARLNLSGPGAQSLAMLGDVRYPPVASVVLGYRREDVQHPLDGFGMLVPQVENFRILGALFSSTLFPNRAPNGCVTLTAYVGGTRAPELTERPMDEVVRMTQEDLARILDIRGKPVFSHTVLYPRAIPQYEVGYGKYKEFMNRLESAMPGLYFAGHYRDGISLGDSIVSGHTADERIAGSPLFAKAS